MVRVKFVSSHKALRLSFLKVMGSTTGSAYLHAAVEYIERKQINRNISLAGKRGKQVVG